MEFGYGVWMTCNENSLVGVKMCSDTVELHLQGALTAFVLPVHSKEDLQT